jgi:hypothetical protein
MSNNIKDLYALFEAFAAVRPWGLTLTGPEEAEALKSWANWRGHKVVESHYVTPSDAYANLSVTLEETCCKITVLGYRKLTDEERATTEALAVTRTQESRVGHREVAL